MRKHQRRNNYDMERASAAAARKAQKSKRKAPATTPEHAALLECASRIRRMRLFGQVVPDELNDEYNTLLAQHLATKGVAA